MLVITSYSIHYTKLYDRLRNPIMYLPLTDKMSTTAEQPRTWPCLRRPFYRWLQNHSGQLRPLPFLLADARLKPSLKRYSSSN